MSVYTIVETPQTPSSSHFETYAQHFATLSSRIDHERSSTSSISFALRPSTIAFMEYQRKANGRLAELTNNMSHMLQVSISGIDTICNKVRKCLMDMQFVQRQAALMPEENFIAAELEEIRQIDEMQNGSEDIRPNQIESSCTTLNKIYQGGDVLDNFKNFVNDVNDFDIALETFVDDINGKIEEFSTTSQQLIQEPAVEVEAKTRKRKRKSAKKVRELPKNITIIKKLDIGDFEKRPATPPSPQPIKDGDELTDEIPVDAPDQSQGLIPIQPEVYRRAGSANINQKLLAQLEANDSLIGYQRLMKRSKRLHSAQDPQRVKSKSRTESKSNLSLQSKAINVIKQPNKKRSKHSKIVDLAKTYTNSLWFNDSKLGVKKQVKKEKSLRRNKKPRESLKSLSYTSSTSKRRVSRRSSSKSVKSEVKKTCSCKIEVTNCNRLHEAAKCRMHWMRAKIRQTQNRNLTFCDILDEITKRDLEPFHAEYPRKDNEGTSKEPSVRSTYLYKLLYDKQRPMQQAWTQLLQQPKTKDIFADASISNSGDAVEQTTTSEEPVMRKQKRKSQRKSGKRRGSGHQVKKLMPYLFDPETKSNNQVLLVMPVRVFYDNYEQRRADTPVKLPLLPMKDGGSRPMSPIPKAISLPVALDAVQNHMNQLRNLQQDMKLGVSQKRCKTSKPKTPKRMWAHKYRKTTAENLLKMIERQPPLHPNFGPKSDGLPAKSSENRPTSLGNKRKLGTKSLDGDAKKVVVSRLSPERKPAKKKQVKKVAKDPIHVIRARNEAIQTNIQKAINVIESKMIDIISSTTESSGAEAFDAMEKEINNVLSMMKTKQMSQFKARQIEPKTFSEELARKLQRVLRKSSQSFDATTSVSTELLSIADVYEGDCTAVCKTSSEELPLGTPVGSSRPLSALPCPPPLKVERTTSTDGSQVELGPTTEDKVVTAEVLLVNSENQAEESEVEESLPPPEGEAQEEEHSFRSLSDNHSSGFEEIREDKFMYDVIDMSEFHTGYSTSRLEEIEEKETHGSSNYYTSEDSPRSVVDDVPELTLSYSEQLHRALNRMETIYSELESDGTSTELLQEPQVDTVNSEVFYTPFMKMLREIRKPVVSMDVQNIAKTPSCYNILNFLDTLAGIDDEKVTRKLTRDDFCYYARVMHGPPLVCHQTRLTQRVRYLYQSHEVMDIRREAGDCKIMDLESVKPSRSKRVSFRLAMSEAASQADLDPVGKEDLTALYQQITAAELVANDVQTMSCRSTSSSSEIIEAVHVDSLAQLAGAAPTTMEFVNSEHAPQNLAHVAMIKPYLNFLKLFKGADTKKPLLKVVDCLRVRNDFEVIERRRGCGGKGRRGGNLDKVHYKFLLKVVYGFIFILMYTAFNINIRCIV